MNNSTMTRKHSLLSDFIETVLNIDATSVVRNLECRSFPLDDKFECVGSLIEFMDGFMLQALTSINAGDFQKLILSRIPGYQEVLP